MAPRAVSRSSLLNHMAREHSFSIGLPDNIVYCSEFLDTLQDKLDRYANRCFLFTALSFVSRAFSFCSPRFSLQCLYCEKTFRDKTTLKDHMRKKAHRRISAKNHEYDRFYVINYLVKPSDTLATRFHVRINEAVL